MSDQQLREHLAEFEKKAWWGHLHNASRAAQDLGDWDQAEVLQRRAWNMEHTEQAGYRWQLLLRTRGKVEAAIVFLRDMLKRFGDDKAAPHYGLMMALSSVGEHAAAVEHGRRALALDPKTYAPAISAVWWARAKELAAVGEHARRVSLMDESLAAAPDDLNTVLRVANYSYYQCRDFQRAETLYQQALVLAPGNHLVMCNLAGLLRERGDYDRAVPMLVECFESHPTNGFFLGACVGETNVVFATRSPLIRVQQSAKYLQQQDARPHIPLANVVFDVHYGARFHDAIEHPHTRAKRDRHVHARCRQGARLMMSPAEKTPVARASPRCWGTPSACSASRRTRPSARTPGSLTGGCRL